MQITQFILIIFLGRSLGNLSVNITVYYESLCPFSRIFLAHHLLPTYSMVRDILNVELVPFGLADFTKDGESWTFTCQHGPYECTGNKIQSCAIYLYSSKESLGFVGCCSTARDPIEAAQKCATKNHLDWSQIDECVNSNLGNELLYENGVKTKAKKDIYGVPYITIDGVHNGLYQRRSRKDLLDLVCSLYNETKPANCPPN